MKMLQSVFRILLIGCLIFYCSSAIDVSTSILNKKVKIAIIDNNRITISLERNEGKRHIVSLGEHIPLIGEPIWKSSSKQFTSRWENGIQLTLSASRAGNGIYRLRSSWKAPPNILTLQQCIDLGQNNWYGGSEMYYQPWPIQTSNFDKIPYVTGNSVGNVMVPYFLSSASIAYFAGPTNPLFVSLGTEVSNSVCLTVEFTEPYRNTNGRPLVLDLDTTWNDPADVKALWLSDSATHFGHPAQAPSAKVARDPIWSTWAAYKTLINQTKVIQFAQDIHDHGFSASQIEIDDNWETCYGDERFDPKKFPDAAAMVTEIKNLGYDVTVWVHPFVNTNCPTFTEGETGGYFVKVNGTEQTGITSWWEGSQSGIIDITNPSAVSWWRQRLTNLTEEVGITAYKFDAGESTWLPKNAYLNTDEALQPGSYTPKYVEFAKYFGGQVEARVGYYSQTLGSIYIRLLDRDSVWGLNNGLQSVITSTLHFGIVGFPFVLPDYIGGNAYGIWPDRELFIRWAQLNAFLPTMQFSILPWSYDDEVTNITKQMIQLHQSVGDVIDSAAAQALQDGSPIIRPVWWLDWSDVTAQAINDQFLLGNTYLVAPIVTQGAVARDIYIPSGTWTDMLRGGDVTGPQWLYNYAVALNEISYFKNTAA